MPPNEAQAKPDDKPSPPLTDSQRIAQAEARRKAILNAALDCIIGMDHHGRVIEWNPAATRVFGYSAEEAIGREMAELIIPERMREAHRKGLARFIATGDGPILGKRLELMGVRKDGSEFPVELAITASDGQPPEFIGYLRDISERKRAEEAIRITAARTGLVIEQSPLAILSFANDGRFLSANKAWEELWGRPASSLEGYNILKDAQLAAKGVMAYIHRAFRGEQVHVPGVEYERIGRDKRSHWIESRMYPVKDRSGVMLEVVALMQDITETKAIEEERLRILAREKAAREQAEAASRAKDDFLAVISHELRTPLTPILGWTRMLRGKKLSAADIERALEVIERNVRAQGQLVEDLLDVSRIIAGKLRLNFKTTDVASVAQHAIDTVRPAANAKNIAIAFQSDPQLPMIVADPSRLQQVFWNLLSNAAKFTPKDGKIAVACRSASPAVEVAVSDNGEGITPEYLPQVFDRFSQADPSSTRMHGGLGLGLAIVKHIVELHGGIVRAESAGPGRGAIFTVRLPVTEALARAGDSGPVYRTPLKGLDAVPLLKDLRVLVVDDEADSREFVAAALNQWGVRVTLAASVAEALEAMDCERPEVLIGDIGMPDEDGYALIRKVRARPLEKGGTIPAIALTAFARAEDRERALAEGYQRHVSKPVDPMELAAIVANVARH